MSILHRITMRALLVVGLLSGLSLLGQRVTRSRRWKRVFASPRDDQALVLLVLDQRQHLEGRDHARSGSDGARRHRRGIDRQRVLRRHRRRRRQGVERTMVGDGRTCHSRRRTRGRRHRHVQLPGLEPVGRPVDQAASRPCAISSRPKRACRGPRSLQQLLPVPKEPFQDVAVLAFPAPLADAESLATRTPQVSCEPAVAGRGAGGRRPDGHGVRYCRAGAGRALTIDIAVAEPLTVRQLTLVPGESAWAAQCELQAADGAGTFQTVRRFRFDRSNMSDQRRSHAARAGHGCVRPGDGSAVSPCASRVIAGRRRWPKSICPLPRASSRSWKNNSAKCIPRRRPMWDTYLWPRQPEPDEPALSIPPARVIDLTEQLAADGTLRWEVPAGEWVILRTGMTTTGTRNSPASPEGSGLEVDKMNRQAAALHFDAFIGELLRRMPAE